jgi:DNA-binding winged helix-turn-helix (wHTH) protein
MNQDPEVRGADRPDAIVALRTQPPSGVLAVALKSGKRDHATMQRLVAQTRRLSDAQRTLQALLEECRSNIERLSRIAPQAARRIASTNGNGTASVATRRFTSLTGSDGGPVPALRAMNGEAAIPWRDDQRLLVGGVEVLPMRQTVINGSRTYRLTPTEWQLLAYLLSRAGEVLSRAELATGAWGPGFASRASEVEVYISRLRKKLDVPGASRLIETVRGSGYRLTVAPRVSQPAQAV